MKTALGLACLSLFFLSGCSARLVYLSSRSTAVQSQNALNINTAAAYELEKLPHIGRQTAEAIVEFRELNGSFRRVEHLMQIRGISETRFAEIRHLIRTE